LIVHIVCMKCGEGCSFHLPLIKRVLPWPSSPKPTIVPPPNPTRSGKDTPYLARQSFRPPPPPTPIPAFRPAAPHQLRPITHLQLTLRTPLFPPAGQKKKNMRSSHHHPPAVPQDPCSLSHMPPPFANLRRRRIWPPFVEEAEEENRLSPTRVSARLLLVARPFVPLDL
jgi:hypothetical protein